MARSAARGLWRQPHDTAVEDADRKHRVDDEAIVSPEQDEPQRSGKCDRDGARGERVDASCGHPQDGHIDDQPQRDGW
jgi:hypothetical protein